MLETINEIAFEDDDFDEVTFYAWNDDTITVDVTGNCDAVELDRDKVKVLFEFLQKFLEGE